jgi:hypothetical protein
MKAITLLEGMSNESIYGPMQVYFAADVDTKFAELNGEIARLREVLKAVADIGFTGEDAVDARDIAKKALGGGA